jgi:DNA-binding PadR family transcriptional regulator
MEKINLSNTQKKVLRSISLSDKRPDTIPESVYNPTVRSLERAGLVRAMYEEGGGVVDVRLTDDGIIYLAENPTLENPVAWQSALAIIASIISVIALFISCVK